ncbi:MAG: oligosaccharide flippase family protein [Myxococcales bacterium]|nr:oligosaccharide flippase family protein [Myxococcales bacterium]
MSETPVAPAPDDGHLKRKAAAGAVWTVLGMGGGSIVRLLSSLILTRLLLEEHFGLIALVNTFITGLHLLSDVGVGQAIVQNKRDDPDFVNTVWTINVMRGVLLYLIATACAGPFAAFYEQPILVPLVRVAAISALFDGFLSASFFTQSRNLNLKRLVGVELGSVIIGTTVTIVWALISPSIWALVWGMVVTAAALTVLSHVWLPGIRSRFRFERQAARSVLSFGLWIFFSSALTFGGNHLDKLIFGKLTTMATLGIYSIAAMLATMLDRIVSKLSLNVLFPLYSATRHSDQDLDETYAAARVPLLTLAGWVVAGISAGGPTVIHILYDPRYAEAGWMLQILVFGAWFRALTAGHTAVALAVGRSQWLAASSLAKVVGVAALVYVGYSFFGFRGAVLGVVGATAAGYVAAVIAAKLLGFDGRLMDLRFSVRVAIAATAGWLAVQWLTGAGFDHLLLHALVVFVVVTAFWARPLLVLLRRARRGKSIFLPGGQGEPSPMA